MVEEKISFRISTHLKNKLQELSNLEKRKLSDFIRMRLEDLVKERTGFDKEKEFAEKEERIKRIAQAINKSYSK